jgi:hypothetical protein
VPATASEHGGGRSHQVGQQIIKETNAHLLEAMGLAD